MTFKTTILSLLFFFIFIPYTLADDGERVGILSECIKKGLINNPGIHEAMQDIEISSARLDEARYSFFLPQFEVSNYFGVVPKANVEDKEQIETATTKGVNMGDLGIYNKFELKAIQPIYTFGRLTGLKDAATGGLEVEHALLKEKKAELIYQIKRAYYGLCLSLKLKEVLEEIMKEVGKAKDKLKRLLDQDSPRVTQIDMLRLKVYEAEVENKYLEVEGKTIEARLYLDALVGEEVEMGIPGLEKEGGSLKELNYFLEITKNRRPQLLALERGLLAKDALIQVEKSLFYPQFFVGGGFKYGLAPGRDEISNPYLIDEYNYFEGFVTVGLRQSLNFLITMARVRKSRAEYHKLRSRKELAETLVLIDVKKAYDEAVKADERISNSTRALKAARSWLTSASQSHDMGLIGIKELIDSFSAYSKAKNEYYKSIYSFNLCLAVLSRAAGVEVAELEY